MSTNPYDGAYHEYRALVLGIDGVGNSDSYDRLDPAHRPIVDRMAKHLAAAWPLDYIGSQQDARTDATWLFARRHTQPDDELLAIELADDMTSCSCGAWRGDFLTTCHMAGRLVADMRSEAGRPACPICFADLKLEPDTDPATGRPVTRWRCLAFDTHTGLWADEPADRTFGSWFKKEN